MSGNNKIGVILYKDGEYEVSVGCEYLNIPNYRALIMPTQVGEETHLNINKLDGNKNGFFIFHKNRYRQALEALGYDL